MHDIGSEQLVIVIIKLSRLVILAGKCVNRSHAADRFGDKAVHSARERFYQLMVLLHLSLDRENYGRNKWYTQESYQRQFYINGEHKDYYTHQQENVLKKAYENIGVELAYGFNIVGRACYESARTVFIKLAN